MKVAILCLFALVAVSQAAFTVNIVQRTQPVLAKTFAQAQFQLRTRSDSELQTTIMQNIMATVNGIIADIQNGVDMTLSTIASYYQILMQAMSDMQGLGGAAVDAASAIIQNAIAALFGSKQRIDLSLSGLASLVASLVAELQVPELIQSALESIFSNDIVQQILAVVFGKRSGISGLFNDLMNNLGGAAGGLVDHISGIVNNIQAALAGGMSEVVAAVQTAVQTAQAEAIQLTTAAAQALIAMIKPWAQQLGAVYNDLVAAINGLVGNNF